MPPPPFLKIPTHIPINMDAHRKWCLLLNKAHLVVSDDMELQRKAAHGICLKQRNNAPETVGRMYAEYCDLINKTYDAYLNSVHLQRAPYMLELISVFLKRVYELRRELELIIVNDYIYIDNSLRQLQKTPFDIQIVVPYHLPLESRPDSIERLLQEMWAESYRRKFSPTPVQSELEMLAFDDLGFQPSSAKSVIMKEKSVHVVIKQGFLHATLIQKHERFRRWHLKVHKENYNKRKTYFTVEPKPLEIRIKAAELIQRMHRSKILQDEILLKATKGKTKEQIKKDKERANIDAAKAAHAEKLMIRKEAEALFKARMNPRTDPGYTFKQSAVKDEIADVFARYRASWSLYDKKFDEKDAPFIYGYITSLITEEIMSQIHIDCRKYVDALRRLDLKLLNKAHKKMFKLEEKPWPKVTPRKKPRKPPKEKIFNVDDALMRTIQEVFDLELVSKPTRKLKDIWGEMNYAAYDYSILDPNVEYKTPYYGDVKRRLLLSCDFGTGIAPGVKRNKSVLLFGPERNGKSFLVDCVAGEINAVKIDISPEKFSAVSDKPAKLMTQVLTAARAFQPAVIFLKNIERVFAKKVLPQDKYLKAKVMEALLPKMIKAVSEKDKIIFIATCSLPLSARPGMMHLFQEPILVPITDYGTLQFFFYNKLQAIRSMPRDYCVQSIAKLLMGYGFGVIFELFEKIMSPERIVDLNIKPLDGMEFMDPLLNSGLEPVTQEDFKVYVDFYLQHSHLRQPRIEYDIINASRAVAYEKLDKAKKSKAKQKA